MLPARTDRSDEDPQRSAWRVLRAAAAARDPRSGRGETGTDGSFGLDAAGERVRLPAERASAWLVREGAGGWAVGPAAPAAARALLDLYAPVCAASAGTPFTLAHLGQSLDGHIATSTGDSYYVTGPANVTHLHRLRALCDAVIVGAGTVARDDPQLTVRNVEGRNPTRVVLDPRRRLDERRRVFDDEAPTIVVAADAARDARASGRAELVTVPCRDGKLDLAAVLDALHARGLHAVFVEGGGATVSAFVEAGLLDRVQIAIAPLVTGSGRPGLSLRARDKIADCLRPKHRVFTMGGDVLFDCDLRASAPAESGSPLEIARVV